MSPQPLSAIRSYERRSDLRPRRSFAGEPSLGYAMNEETTHHRRRTARAAHLTAAPVRGIALCTVAALALIPACLLQWANVQAFIFKQSYPGTQFSEGRLALALGLATLATSAAAAKAAPRLVYLLPLGASAALALTAWKYDHLGDGFPTFDGFRLTTANPGGGLLLALAASATLVAASTLAVRDRLREGA
jgi:hypothetical protein